MKMADSGKTTPGAGKDMKDVIAQFQHANKGNINLRPVVGGAKPKPPLGQKSSIHEQADTGNDAAKLPRKLKSDNQEGTGNPAGPEAANQFKIALKPVARPSGTGVAAKNFVNQKSVTAGDKPVTSPKDETSETVPKVSSIANKSKMFEQKQPEVTTQSTPTGGVGGGAASAKPKFPVNSNFPKSPVVPKAPQTKTADPAQPNGTTPSANKWKKFESKSDELKPTDQKPDVKREFPFRKSAQDAAQTGDDAAEADDKVGSTNFATIRPVKSTTFTAKPFVPATSSTLPKQYKPPVTSKITKADTEDDDQPKIPPKPSGKAEQPKIPAKTTEDIVQPKIPPRFSDKAEPPKISAKTTEDIDQPKVPLRREQKKPEESAADKTASKQPLPAGRKAEENKPRKVPDVYDQNANKLGGNSAESLPRNMGRPLPKPAEKQYRLLPVPKQKGKAPRKKAKPPAVDLSKYATYATPKTVQPVASQVSVDAYDDGDDLYEDCDNMEVVIKKSSRISEYTEEEEAKIEKSAKLKQPTTNTDNYGKMFNAPSVDVDEYDDDEIYQEID